MRRWHARLTQQCATHRVFLHHSLRSLHLRVHRPRVLQSAKSSKLAQRAKRRSCAFSAYEIVCEALVRCLVSRGRFVQRWLGLLLFAEADFEAAGFSAVTDVLRAWFAAFGGSGLTSLVRSYRPALVDSEQLRVAGVGCFAGLRVSRHSLGWRHRALGRRQRAARLGGGRPSQASPRRRHEHERLGDGHRKKNVLFRRQKDSSTLGRKGKESRESRGFWRGT